MEIKKDSWHYRFIKWTKTNPSTNLCNYFWQVVGPPLIGTFFVLALIAAFAGLISEHGWSLLWIIPLGIILIIVACVVMVAIVGLFDILREKLFGPKVIKQSSSPKEKEPNIFFEWLRAKKAKVCPILEFK